MVVRIGTRGDTVPSKLESERWTHTRLIPDKEASGCLPSERLIGMTKADLGYFVSSLFIDSGDGPEGIENEGKGRFIVDI